MRLKVARVPLTATTATTGGAVAAWANPEGANIAIVRVLLAVNTASTGAANLSVGIAANATTSNATTFDAKAVGTAGLFDNADDTDNGSTGIAKAQKMTSTQYITATGSADTTGLVGNLFIYYHSLA